MIAILKFLTKFSKPNFNFFTKDMCAIWLTFFEANRNNKLKNFLINFFFHIQFNWFQLPVRVTFLPVCQIQSRFYTSITKCKLLKASLLINQIKHSILSWFTTCVFNNTRDMHTFVVIAFFGLTLKAHRLYLFPIYKSTCSKYSYWEPLV